MALTATEEKELKKLETINSPVPSQKKRMLKLKQLKNIKRKELPKKPKIVPITDKYSSGTKGKPFVEKPTEKKKPLFKLRPDRKTTAKQRMDKVDARLKVKKKPINKRILNSTSSSVSLPKKRLKQPTVLKSKVSKTPTVNPNSKTGQYKAPKPKEESTFSSLLKFLRNKLSPSKSVSKDKIKKALPSDGTYTDKQIKSLQEALIPSVPFSVNERSKVKPRSSSYKERTPPGKAMPKKEVVKNNNRKLTQSERILKAKPRPSKKPQLKKPIVSKREQSKIDAGAGKSKLKLKDDRAEFAKAVKNMGSKDKVKSLSSNNPIFKEIIKSKGGEPAFRDKKNLSSMIGRAIGSKTTPEESMNTAVYNELANEYNNDSGQMSEAKKDLYLKMKNSKSGGKVGKKKGGMVKRSYGGKVKRNMGGMVSPRKKVVFRRGGGRALRGMGKAIYSNKMY